MNKTQKKKEAKLMRAALETEAKILSVKGYVAAVTAINDLLADKDDERIHRFIELLDETNRKRNAEKRV